jgi:hypothetical protein
MSVPVTENLLLLSDYDNVTQVIKFVTELCQLFLSLD